MAPPRLSRAPIPPRPVIFLDRHGYRQRRLRDALRLLPVLGTTLFMVPVLWPRGTEGMPTSSALIYLFAGWAALVALAAILAARMHPEPGDEPSSRLRPAGSEDSLAEMAGTPPTRGAP